MGDIVSAPDGVSKTHSEVAGNGRRVQKRGPAAAGERVSATGGFIVSFSPIFVLCLPGQAGGLMMITGTFAPANPSVISVPTLWMPMIRVSISDSTDPVVHSIVEENVIALVDTGSDFCRIDSDMINRHPTFKQVGEAQSTSPTGIATQKPILYR